MPLPTSASFQSLKSVGLFMIGPYTFYREGNGGSWQGVTAGRTGSQDSNSGQLPSEPKPLPSWLPFLQVSSFSAVLFVSPKPIEAGLSPISQAGTQVLARVLFCAWLLAAELGLLPGPLTERTPGWATVARWGLRRWGQGSGRLPSVQGCGREACPEPVLGSRSFISSMTCRAHLDLVWIQP